MRRSLLALLFSLLAAAQTRPVTVTILATTDLHGYLLPVDYVTDRPAPRGLAAAATLIRQVRAANPYTLLIDCGDTIQGSPLETVYQSGPRTLGDPMMRAMNLLGYAAMTVGNHEYTAGPAAMEQARRDARFPWLAANTTGFDASIVRTIAGIRVAVVGVTTPAVPLLEPAGRLGAHRFIPAIPVVRRAVASLHADAVVVAAHSGLGRDGEDPDENIVATLAREVPGIDAIVYGHSHKEHAAESIGKVLIVQPKYWGQSLARIDLTFAGNTLTAKTAALIPVAPSTPAAPDVAALARPYEEATRRYLDTPVTTAAHDLDAAALADLVNRVQLAASHADVSLTAPIDPAIRVPKGPVTRRQLTAVYPYDNELYVILGTARMLQGIADRVAGARPRIPDRPLRIALNSYRATQPPFRGAAVIWKSSRSIRDLLAAATW